MSDQLLMLGLACSLLLFHRGARRLLARILAYALRETLRSVLRGLGWRRRRTHPRKAAPAGRRKKVVAR
jgi:hypothetical protein